MAQNGSQPRSEIRDPGGAGERDLALIQVDRTRGITLDLQDTGNAPVSQRIQGDRDRCSF
jgi:hypothetical protein